MKDTIKELEKYRSHIILMGLFVFLLHGAKLNSNIIGIDTEDLIHLEEKFYGGWLGTGRQGLVFLKYVLGNSSMNPYFSGILTLLFFTLAVTVFFIFWDWILGKGLKPSYSLLAAGMGGILWISQPVMAEQFYFSLQSAEIAVGFLVTAAGLAMARLWTDSAAACKRTKQGIFCAAGAVLCFLLAFSSYQIFVVLAIFGVITILLLQQFKKLVLEEEYDNRELWKKTGCYIALFFIAFLLNTVITTLFFHTSSGYLSEQVSWGNVPAGSCLRMIIGHIVKLFTGYDATFYQAGFGILCVLALCQLCMLLKQKAKGRKLVVFQTLFLFFALLTTPFLMTLVMGAAPAVRSQLVLPVITGFMAYLNVLLAAEQKEQTGRRLFLVLLTAVVLVSGWKQARTTESLYYTDACRYQQDVAMGEELIKRLEAVNVWNYPVAIVGSREFQPNHACTIGETIGKSFFDYDAEVEPLNYWSTRRILGFLHTLGADYAQVPQEQMAQALEYSTYMPEWPSEGCVQFFDDMVVVKLSHYAEEE